MFDRSLMKWLKCYAKLSPFIHLVIAIIFGLAISVRSDFGFLDFSSSVISTLLVQMSGALLALSWPAAQMASYSVEQASDFLERILKTERERADINYLNNKFKELKESLEPGRRGVLMAFISFLLALSSIVIPQHYLINNSLQLLADDLLCGLSFTFLITAVLNFLPTVLDAFKLTALDSAIKALSSLEKNQETSDAP